MNQKFGLSWWCHLLICVFCVVVLILLCCDHDPATTYRIPYALAVAALFTAHWSALI